MPFVEEPDHFLAVVSGFLHDVDHQATAVVADTMLFGYATDAAVAGARWGSGQWPRAAMLASS